MSGEQTSFLAGADAPAEGQATTPQQDTQAAKPEATAEGSILGAGTQEGQQPKDGQAEATKPAPVELKVPEGVDLGKDVLEALKAGDPQKVVDAMAAERQQSDAEWAKQDQQWRSQVQSDPELGGANLDATALACRKAMAKYGSPELAKFLDDMGIGNHPVLVRAFARIGKALGEDTVAGTTTSTARTVPPDTDEAVARGLWPEMFQPAERN